MKRLLAVAGALVFACALTVRAAGPEDQYLAVYYLLQQGDTASAAGNNAEAAGRYTDALAALQKLQRAYPDWQNNVVSFRLGYLQKRIAAVGGTAGPAGPAPVEPARPPGTGVTNAESDAQMGALQAQMTALQANNASLQAKLREALAARPAAVDPAQLSRAEELIRDLSKQNELLKVSLDDAQARATAAANAKQVARLRQEVDEANRKLAAESARTKALLREKGDLEDRLGKAAASPSDSSSVQLARRKLEEAEQRVLEQRRWPASSRATRPRSRRGWARWRPRRPARRPCARKMKCSDARSPTCGRRPPRRTA